MQHRMPRVRHALLASAAIIVLAPAGAAVADTLFVPALVATAGGDAPQGPRAAATGTAAGTAAPALYLPATSTPGTSTITVAIPRITALRDSYSRLQRSSRDRSEERRVGKEG